MIKITEKEREIIERYFNVCENEEYIELEMWTDGGVDMLIYINQNEHDNILSGIEEYIDSFDIDEEIDIYRQDKYYRENFTITQSVKDFEDYITTLKNVCDELSKIENNVNNSCKCDTNYIDELNYITFVLGYDLLHDRLQASDIESTCDIAYDICNSIAKLYLDSEEYKNLKYSSYEMLVCWLNNNLELVNSYFRG